MGEVMLIFAGLKRHRCVRAVTHFASQAESQVPPAKKSQHDRRHERRQAMLQAATEVFLEHGYEAARLDQVIQRSGGSLATLYAEFKNKEGLFAAIIDEICAQMVGALPRLDAPASTTPEQVLCRFGLTYLRLLLTPVSLALYRMVIGESGRFPELSRAVFLANPTAAADRLAGYLREQERRGLVVVPDADLAARHFLEMLKGDLHTRALTQAGPPILRHEIRRCIRDATQTFLLGITFQKRAST